MSFGETLRANLVHKIRNLRKVAVSKNAVQLRHGVKKVICIALCKTAGKHDF